MSEDRAKSAVHRRGSEGAPDTLPVERMLSGDFGSPAEVLADNTLTADQKREVFDTWLRDLEGQPQSTEQKALRSLIEDARASLPTSRA